MISFQKCLCAQGDETIAPLWKSSGKMYGPTGLNLFPRQEEISATKRHATPEAQVTQSLRSCDVCDCADLELRKRQRGRAGARVPQRPAWPRPLVWSWGLGRGDCPSLASGGPLQRPFTSLGLDSVLTHGSHFDHHWGLGCPWGLSWESSSPHLQGHWTAWLPSAQHLLQLAPGRELTAYHCPQSLAAGTLVIATLQERKEAAQEWCHLPEVAHQTGSRTRFWTQTQMPCSRPLSHPVLTVCRCVS